MRKKKKEKQDDLDAKKLLLASRGNVRKVVDRGTGKTGVKKSRFSPLNLFKERTNPLRKKSTMIRAANSRLGWALESEEMRFPSNLPLIFSTGRQLYGCFFSWCVRLSKKKKSVVRPKKKGDLRIAATRKQQQSSAWYLNVIPLTNETLTC
jgi:hypothetical protein